MTEYIPLICAIVLAIAVLYALFSKIRTTKHIDIASMRLGGETKCANYQDVLDEIVKYRISRIDRGLDPNTGSEFIAFGPEFSGQLLGAAIRSVYSAINLYGELPEVSAHIAAKQRARLNSIAGRCD